ncbi:MAG: TIGR03621 family F420-dependent LLM class oxidoreductase [Acidimicrobiia bacterium]|nr:TIGR03621 family F420-dependent LLM class oxidoreductase [Acidimicrobiia bacterium]
MPRPFRFAVQTGPFGEPETLRGYAQRVEELGYDELFSFDHLGAVDPFLPLLVAAEATTTLRFGPLVLNNEFHNPALLARTAATFDALTGGRLVLGLGTGYMRSEHDAASIELRVPGERVTRFAETVPAIRQLLDDGTCTFAGRHVSLRIDDLGVRPVQTHVPILIGGHGRRVVSVAAEHADVFQFTGLVHHPVTGAPSGAGFAIAHVERRRDWLRDAAGGRTDHIELSALVQATHVGEGWEDAAEKFAVAIAADRDVVDETPFALIGSPDSIVDKLHRLRERLGISHFVVRDPEGFAPIVAKLAAT